MAAKSISNTALVKLLGVKTKVKKRKTNYEKRDKYRELYRTFASLTEKYFSDGYDIDVPHINR